MNKEFLIVPPLCVGEFKLGMSEMELQSKLAQFSKSSEAGRIIYKTDPYTFYVSPSKHILFEIIVSKGFAGSFRGIHIGDTMESAIKKVGPVSNVADDYYIIEGYSSGLLLGFSAEKFDAKLEWIALFAEEYE